MRVIALLSFYDEPIELLVACLSGLAKAGVDHVVALDGRYAMYPADAPISHVNQHSAIVLACRNLGMACTLSVPNEPWAGNEVEKRTALFALGWSVARDGDWFWVQDADQIVSDIPNGWKERLAATQHDVATVTMHDCVVAENPSDDWPADFKMRSLFRAQPITVQTNHCTYVAEDGRVLWGMVVAGSDRGRCEVPALDLAGLKVDHCPQVRPVDRLKAKGEYYVGRDAAGIERGECECGEPAVRLVSRHWRVVPETGKAVAEWHEACEKHAKRWEYDGQWEMRKLGIDPSTAHNRNGEIPIT